MAKKEEEPRNAYDAAKKIVTYCNFIINSYENFHPETVDTNKVAERIEMYLQLLRR